MAATLSNFFKAIGSQLSANAPAPESFSCSISHQHLLPPCLRGVQQAAELVVNWGYLMTVRRRIVAKPHLSAEQRWVRHRGLRPSEMLTSDGAIRADFPALPPIHLADFSTWLRRALSSRHTSDPESRPLFHREASAVVALALAGLRLPPCSSFRRDDLAYHLHSRDCRMPQIHYRFLRGLPLIEK